MCRANRVVVRDSDYNVSLRCSNGAFLMKSPKLKDELVRLIYATADFCGVDINAWAVMDNHIHIEMHVGDPSRETWKGDECPPTTEFARRPCDPGRDSLDVGYTLSDEETISRISKLYSKSKTAEIAARWRNWRKDGYSSAIEEDKRQYLIRMHNISQFADPGRDSLDVGYTLSDEDTISRISKLYSKSKTAEIAARWRNWRKEGYSSAIEEDKRQYLIRMHNISQFAHTFAQRAARAVKLYHEGHLGHVWGERTYTGIVEPTRNVRLTVISYIDYNPVKAGMTKSPLAYRWTSFAAANGSGPYARRCREGYERSLSLSWREAREAVLRSFAARAADRGQPPNGESSSAEGRRILSIAEAMRRHAKTLFRSVAIASDISFLDNIKSSIPNGHVMPPFRRLMDLCGMIDWDWDSLPTGT